MAFNWDTSNPATGNAPAQHPANERAFRTTVHDMFLVEHDADGASDAHIFPSGDIAARDALTWPDTGSLYISNEDLASSAFPLQLHFRSGTNWFRVGEFITGTKMLFAQATAPTFWTQSADNDRIIRVVSGAGGGSAGAWAISGLSIESASHTHNAVGVTGGENQLHYHFVGTTTGTPSGTQNCQGGGGAGCGSGHPNEVHAFTVNSTTESALHDHNISFAMGSENTNHSHVGDGNWRPAYIDVIYAVKN